MKLQYRRIVRALCASIVFWGGLHLVILAIAAIKMKDIALLNIFHILQINFLFPFPVERLLSNTISTAALLGVYALFLTIL